MRTAFTLACLWLAIVALAAACTSQPTERVVSAHSALLAQGKACVSPSDCASNFCVDGVCCNNACGGTMQQPCGVRDQFSCSNIYGNVNGLTDGTCFTLMNGDFCGDLPTCDPCSARGANLTNGNNCPNPQLFTRNGLVCRAGENGCADDICANGICPMKGNNCPDGGGDSGADAASDSGADAATDSGADAASDSGADSGVDAATDSGVTDSGVGDSGADSGADASGDAYAGH